MNIPGSTQHLAQAALRSGALRKTRAAWPRLGVFERFEQLVSLALTVVIGMVVIVALTHLIIEAMRLLFGSLLLPVDHSTFQSLFGMILTVLIALEFNHTILGILHRRDNIVQLRTVILIALLAIARKFLIIDATLLEPLTLLGLAAAVLALGCVYWLVREQDHREDQGSHSMGGAMEAK